MKYEFEFSRKELSLLLWIRKKPRRWKSIAKWLGYDDDGVNITLSRLERLLSYEGSILTSDIALNDIGETFAQAEFDRRFDMYLTRVAAIAALIISAISAILAGLKL